VKSIFEAIKCIEKRYNSDASLIWSDKSPSAEVVCRFLEFHGVGPKIASMAANILARDFKVPFSDYSSIDISADVHIKRVFSRLDLCAENPTVDQVIYKARSLYPDFPGIMDLPCWELGRSCCRPQNPNCGDCYMNDICPKAALLK
jgi:endonuclease III